MKFPLGACPVGNWLVDVVD